MKYKFLFVVALTFLLSTKIVAQFVPTPDHVVVVMLENHGYADIIGSVDAPYINSLANDTFGALFTESHGVTHPSQPNYLYLFSGDDQNVILDFTPIGALLPFTTDNLGAELLQNGRTFIGYSEDLPSVGFTGDVSGAYHRKHSPWINWQDGSTNGIPSALNQPFTSFPANYNNLPTLSFVIPNQDHDMHDGTINQADVWIQQNIGAYAQWAKANNSLLIITFDEDDGIIPGAGVNHIATIFVGQMVKRGQYNENIDHNNVLRTMEEMYSLPHAGSSSSATPITDCWVYKTHAAFGANPTAICPNSSIQLSDATTNVPTNWQWIFNGGSPASSTVQNPSVTYNNAGVFDVTLITSNQMGFDTLTLHNYVTVHPTPVLHLSSDSLSICVGDTATIIATEASIYNWLPSPNLIYSNGGTMKANPSSNSYYKVVGASFGCLSDTVTVEITVDTLLYSSLTLSPSADTTVCQNTVASFFADAANGGSSPSYQWKVDGTNTGANAPTFSAYAFANSFTVSCLFTSSAGCAVPHTIQSNIIHVTVSAQPHPVITSVDSLLSSDAATSYQWYYNGNPIAGANSQTYVADSSGTYRVEAFNADGCSGMSNSITVVLATNTVENISAQNSFTIYPNPNKGEFVLKFFENEKGECQLKVYDIGGRLVFENSFSVMKQQIPISLNTLEKGVYFISVEMNNRKEVHKLLIE